MKLTRNCRGAGPPADKTDHAELDDELPGFGVRLRGGS